MNSVTLKYNECTFLIRKVEGSSFNNTNNPGSPYKVHIEVVQPEGQHFSPGSLLNMGICVQDVGEFLNTKLQELMTTFMPGISRSAYDRVYSFRPQEVDNKVIMEFFLVA